MMRCMTTREVGSLEELDAALAGRRSLAGLRIQGVDLRAREQVLLRSDPAGAVVLGGVLSDRLEEHLRHGGALVFPAVTGAPIDPYRSRLYDATELYAGLEETGYAGTPDARAFAWFNDRSVQQDVYTTLLRAVHDDSMGDALDELCAGRRVVGVMGGHALRRGEPAYAEAARLGRGLARAGMLVATGGGPGAMEAADLGARSAHRDNRHFDRALERLAAVPSYRPDVSAWATLGLSVREDLGSPGQVSSVGVPTWFYGHEPPNVFAGRDRQVLLQRPARGRPAGPVHRRRGVPARRGGDRAGGVPGRDRALLREPPHRSVGAGRPLGLADRPAGVALAVGPGRRPSDAGHRAPRRDRGRGDRGLPVSGAPPGPGPAVIRRATREDAARIVALRDEAARWLIGRGIRQWEPGQVSESDVVGWLATGRMYVAEVGEEDGAAVVGCVRVAWDDVPVWGRRPPDAGYVQALVTARSESVRGLGRRLLGHAEAVIGRSGRPLARLSCQRGNEGLEAFYAAAGYVEVGARAFDVPGWDPVTLRERRLS